MSAAVVSEDIHQGYRVLGNYRTDAAVRGTYELRMRSPTRFPQQVYAT